MDDATTQILISVIVTLIASGGFWAFLQRILDRNSVRTQMLIGLGHDRIVYLGLKYIERGWITTDEYENLYEYLYKPYEKLGGNGSAKRIMDEVKRLPTRNPNTTKEAHDDT